MSWSEGEILSLIELVKYEISLYDISRPDHKDRSKINHTWNKIGRRLNKKGFEVKRMWSNLTKTYAWLVQNKKFEMEEEGTWPYLEAMNFLKPFVKDYVLCEKVIGEELINYEATLEAGIPVPVLSTEISSSASEGNPFILETPFNADGNSEDSIVDDAPQSPKITLSPNLPNNIIQKKNMEVEDALCQYLRKKISKQKDPNEFFLTSVAHDMRLLSPPDQVVFKMKVQQLLVEMMHKSHPSG